MIDITGKRLAGLARGVAMFKETGVLENASIANYGAGWDRSTVEAELSKSQEKLAQLSRGLARARDAVKDASRQSDPEAIRDAKDALNSIMSKWDNESRVLEGIQRELASAPRNNAGLARGISKYGSKQEGGK